MSALPMTPEKLAEALRGPNAEAVLLSLLRADPRRDVLRACALPLAFDTALYEVVAPKNAPSLDAVASWSEVEPIVGREGFFRVARRRETMAWWWEPGDLPEVVPVRLAALARRLAPHVEKHGTQYELLHALLFCNERRARSLFKRLYSAADSQFDLAACHELLGVTSEALPFVSSGFKKDWEQQRAYFDARTRFSDDFHRSRLYLRRETLETKLDALFGKSSKWILNLHATGGMGKTAAIQWLVAHRCVTPRRRIPVARFDLDFDEIFELTDGKRLVSRLVEQLDPQIPGNDFSRIFDDITTALAAEAPRLINVAIDNYDVEIASRFARALVEAIGKEPILIIIDTIENALLHRNELKKVIALLAAIRVSAPGIRLLLAGRYPLKDIAESNDFADDCNEVFLDPMSGDEAEDYLFNKRRLTDRKIVKLVVKNSGGIPLKLSLYADIIRTTPDLTEQDIREYGRKGADVIYLIERVVDRLHKEPMLQWVLRYGAVPRKLTLPFIENVMQPYLRDAMAKATAADTPEKNLPSKYKGKAFRRGLIASPEAPIDFALLWADLRKYASDHSWVYPDPDPARKDTLLFRGDVVNPMRLLLSENPVFTTLHRAAIRYYESAARKASGVEWAALTCEAIYHRYQIRQNGKAAWRAALQRARQRGDPEVIRMIAREITRSEYVDETRALVPAVLVAEAHGIEAALLVRTARAGNADAWNAVGVSVSKGEAALRGRKAADPYLRLAKAADLAQKGSIEQAKKILSEKLRGAPELSRLLLLAELHINEDNSTPAVLSLRKAHRVARGLGFFAPRRPPDVVLDRDPSRIETAIAFHLSRIESLAGRAERAIATIRALLDIGRKRHSPELVRECSWRLSQYRLRCIEPAAALAVSPAYRGEALRQQHLLHDAVRLLNHDIEGLGDVRESDAATREHAAYLYETRMRVLGDLMLMDEARADCQKAIELARRVAGRASLVSVLRAAVKTELKFGAHIRSSAVRDLVGQLNRAANNAPRGDEVAARMTVLAHSHAIHLPQPRLKLFFRSEIRGRVHRLEVAAGGVAWTAERSSWAPKLLREILRITPLGLRIALLTPLRSVTRVEISSAARASLRRAISRPIGGNVKAIDRALQLFRRAAILLTLGFVDDARRDLAAVRRYRSLFERPSFVRAFATVAHRANAWNRLDGWRLLALTKDMDAGDPLRAAMLADESARQKDGNPELTKDLAAELKRSKISGPIEDYVTPLLKAVRGASRPTVRAAYADVDEGEINVRIDGAEQRVVVTTNEGSSTLQRKLDPWEFLGLTERRLGAIVPHEFVAKFLKSSSAVKKRMHEYLFGRMPVRLVRRDIDIGIEIDEVAWHALPWELIMPQSVRGNRRTIFRTAPLERSFPQSIKIDTMLTVTLEKDSAPFSARFFETTVPPRMFRSSLKETSAQAICITSNFSEGTDSATVYLSFTDGPKDLTATALASVFRSNAALRDHPPVVILDALTPSGPSETIRQGMLRNVFAAQLFHTGAVACVLSIGLQSPAIRFQMHPALFDQLRREARAIDLAPARRQRGTVAFPVAIFAPSRVMTLRVMSPRVRVTNGLSKP